MLARVILPALGNHRVSEVTRADIARIHHDLRHIPYDANRCLEIISKMFNLAEMWGLRPDGSNPRNFRSWLRLLSLRSSRDERGERGDGGCVDARRLVLRLKRRPRRRLLSHCAQ